ncbi:lactate utilization protein C [Gracilibacillus sp. S3-1-1]|uniref:Lactate utilization protein C n=1 Tax=Gracilibacillus pellucidus TaxID=3095368 RepID=A0ACC6M5Q0_9BACI|nr:lactate utilization protein C [Gracilibacillus sp. S3-1-1]MDX8046226.1 lactate utilization protein C [Gracilibacillus sp. S3-1-1]
MVKGNIINRDTFLSNIRENLGNIPMNKPVEKPEWSVTPQENVLTNYDQAQLVSVLQNQCKEIHTDFYSTSLEELNQTVINVLTNLQATSIVYTADERFTQTNTEQSLQDLDAFKWDNTNREKSVEIAEKADVGITFSDITLAESGTVVLLNDKGKGRSVSLLPANYIAIIPESTIVRRMTQATNYIHHQVKQGESIASCINFITGPSNSADIEMNLVVGVHGPIRATYIVIDDW